ncbi:hypothetical protein AYK21_05195 [Thermoplasmatales archaeon SG8-52-2]|nr:MAG: hypothetical protein AYK21_05195 [Thermoplasmatales archaeon SG8-52-2]
MYKKIIGILVMTLLIISSVNVLGMANKKIFEKTPLPLQNGSVDQELTTSCGYGMILSPPFINAQGFKPTKESLTSVELWFFKSGNPPTGVEITVGIRVDLYGSDLTAKTINADDVGIGGATWVKFNFDDITIIPEETYYIVCYADGGGTEGNCYCWLFDIGDKYPRGKGWWYNETSATWITIWELFNFDPEWEDPDLCFKTFFRDSEICCDGEINLEGMIPGDERTENFDIYNCGENDSELNWKVIEWPEWGSGWTFSPGSGTGLTPAEGPLTIQVNFIIPSESESSFNGTIKVVNSNDPYDFCEIPVSVTTPRARTLKNKILFQFSERFPNAFPIMRKLLGLI